jgi:hypothetical protein
LVFVLTKYLLGRGVDPEASNTFGIEKWHFLTGLDIPDTPPLLKGASTENIFEQLSPKVKKWTFAKSLFSIIRSQNAFSLINLKH